MSITKSLGCQANSFTGCRAGQTYHILLRISIPYSIQFLSRCSSSNLKITIRIYGKKCKRWSIFRIFVNNRAIYCLFIFFLNYFSNFDRGVEKKKTIHRRVGEIRGEQRRPLRNFEIWCEPNSRCYTLCQNQFGPSQECAPLVFHERIPGNAFEASGERCVFTQTQTLKRRLNEWHPGVVHESLLFDRHAIPSIRVKRDFWNQVFSPILETFRVDSILNLDSIFAPMRPGLKQTITM